MKNIKFILGILLIMSGLTSCRDESLNPIPSTKFKDGVTFTAIAKSSAFLDLSKLEGAKMEFETASERPDLISKVDVMAELIPANGARVLRPLITLPNIIGSTSIPYSQFFTALGITPAQLKPGDVIRAKFVAVTPDGRTFSEDNTVGTLPTAGNSAFTRSINVTVACVFNAAQFATGTWVVDVDEWGDIDKGKEISVTPGPGANDLTIDFYGGPAENFPFEAGSHKPTVITVTNANTGAVTVPKQSYGIYVGDPATYSMEGTGSISGCAGTIELILKHTSTDGYSSGATPAVKFKLVRK
jgi:hypothetical protein